MGNLEVRVWDVGHGLSVWLRTPNGQNHWVDAGYNPDGDFSPSAHVLNNYENVSPIQLLTISHPDKDHFDDIDRLIDAFGDPEVLIRNASLPDEIKFDSCTFDYQKVFKRLDRSFTASVDWKDHPRNPDTNGGVTIESFMLEWSDAGDINNSSVIICYKYSDTLLIFPGDIESKGWELISRKNSLEIAELVRGTKFRILVAPHHGRGSGYCQKMFDDLKPSFVIVSDDYGRQPTDRRFRENATGIRFSNGDVKKYFSTKSNSRVKIVIAPKGLIELTES